MDFEREHNRPVILLVGNIKYVRTELNPKNIRILNVTLRQVFPPSGGKIEKNEMGGACGAYGGGERCAQGSGEEI